MVCLLYQASGRSPMIPLDEALRPTWLFSQTVHECCDRGGYYEQADFAEEYGSRVCIVKLGCWGPVVQCNVMPGLNGLDVLRQIKKRSPNTQVVILSMYANEAYVLAALSNGAAAYVLKDSSSADLVLAVREAAAGRRYLSPPLSARAIEVYQEKPRRQPSIHMKPSPVASARFFISLLKVTLIMRWHAARNQFAHR